MRPAFLRTIGLVSVAAFAQAGSVQLPGLTVPSSAAADRESVVQIFNESYNAYRCAEEISMILFPNLSLVVVVENLLLVMMKWLR
jgi:hypothetical protein